MSVLPITVYGDNILRGKTEKVKAVDDKLISDIQNMFATMRHASGIGLAGNHPYLSFYIFLNVRKIQMPQRKR